MKTITKKAVLLVALYLVTIFTFSLSATDLKPIYGERITAGNQIHWENTSPLDLKFFIVQRSKDAIHYTPVAMVQIDKNQDEYTYIDKKAGRTNWFYRIVDVEMNGLGTFSSAVYMECASELNERMPFVNITVNDNIAKQLNTWLIDVEYPVTTKLGVAYFH